MMACLLATNTVVMANSGRRRELAARLAIFETAITAKHSYNGELVRKVTLQRPF